MYFLKVPSTLVMEGGWGWGWGTHAGGCYCLVLRCAGSPSGAPRCRSSVLHCIKSSTETPCHHSISILRCAAPWCHWIIGKMRRDPVPMNTAVELPRSHQSDACWCDPSKPSSAVAFLPQEADQTVNIGHSWSMRDAVNHGNVLLSN